MAASTKENPAHCAPALVSPSAPRPASGLKNATGIGNAIDPGPFMQMKRNGEMVLLMFERISLVLPRCGAIGLAYWLSELVE